MNINEKLNALHNAVEKAKKDQAQYDTEYNAALVRYFDSIDLDK